MPSSRCELSDDICPVRDELLGELYRANDLFVPGFVYTLAPDIRALLALFCYRRRHLHSVGLAIGRVAIKTVWYGPEAALAHLSSPVLEKRLGARCSQPAQTGERLRLRQASCECLPMTTTWRWKPRPIPYL